ncbi:hypothetical protein FQN55_003436 [Onygenales sp. PD_40]|nr:hypothetical protein FQN55_003436 [Onygenales sp. PD_40]KAK2769620.1 hypothetical protein FQN53_005979 [Emmonsiellopsis sp. PD_33]KAK2781447.1 hypothetical protein FQN52_001639 [Onygenales sp. PD_12]KAK2802896.1 hypothetical protein FQN51_004158 [Onygenales sp. PD_10]
MSLQPALAPAPHPQMQDIKNNQAVQDHADQVLHDQLLAAQHQLHQSHHAPPPPRPQPGAAPAHIQPASSSPRDQNISIDPAIAGPAAMIHPSAESPGDENAADGRKTYGKRELSTSKRAAQNRAAQRAFRQRKEGYIRKLEEQVKDYEMLLENYKAIQAENYQLREYIISLQSRLIDSQNEVPELPSNIDLSQPRNDPPAPAPTMATTTTAQPTAPGEQPEQVNALNRIAVAGLGMRKHQHEEAAFLGANNSPSKRMRFDGLPEAGDVKGDAAGNAPS